MMTAVALIDAPRLSVRCDDPDRLRYQSLFESSPTAQLVATRGGEVVTCNRAFLDLFGFETVGSATGVPLRRLFCDGQVFDSVLGLLLSSGCAEIDDSMRLQSAQGRAVFVQGVLVAAEAGAFGVEVHGHLHDRTAMRAQEEQLWWSRRMDHVMVIGRRILHDLNNHLAVIQGGVVLARSDHGAEALTYVSEAVHRAGEAVGSFQRLATQCSARQSADVSVRVRRLLELLASTLPQGVELAMQLEEGLPQPEVAQEELELIVICLVNDACECLPLGGTLKIELGPGRQTTDSGSRGSNPRVELAVTHRAAGIAADTRAQLERRSALRLQRMAGLTTAERIVRLRQGAIRVMKDQGNGSSVVVDLPALDKQH